jgi:penicillin amidase
MAWHLGNGTLPYDGSTGQGEWERIVGFEELSKSINPNTGFLVGSNQIAAGPEYFARYPAQFRYNAGYRARRMNELLNTREQLSVEDMQAFQTDTLSILARDFTPHLIAFIQNRDKDEHMVSVLKLMSAWDYRMDMASPAPSIIAVWTAFLAEAVFGDEWKMLGLNRRVFPQEPILEALLRTQTDAIWFDNISTSDKTETARDAMNNAWKNTLNSLTAFFETDDIEKWQWGALHQLEFRHMTGELDALNFGPVPVSGSGHTIAAPRNTLLNDGQLDPTHAHHGAHHRMVTGFGNMQKSVSVLPGGNSGLHTLGAPFGQFDAYLRGNYHSEYFTADTPQKFTDSCESIVSKITFSKQGEK